MKEKINLQEVFDNRLLEKTGELKKALDLHIKQNDNRRMVLKVGLFKVSIAEELDKLWKGENEKGWAESDPFTLELFSLFDKKVDLYVCNNIDSFITEFLPALKKNFKQAKHLVPANIKLNPAGIAILLAEKYALEIFMYYIDKIGLKDDEDAEAYLKRFKLQTE